MGNFRSVLSTTYNSLPREMIWAINCRRFAKYWRSANVIFVHVPKAAGNSVSTTLYGRHLGHLRARDIQKFAPNDFQQFYKFAFIRNPWDRLYSAYHFAKQGGTAAVKVSQPEQYKVPAFSSFERFVNEWLSEKDVTALDYVFMPQSSFILDESGTVIVDYLGRFERFDECMSDVSQMLNRDLQIPVTNQVTKELPYREVYSAALINLVGDIYKKDIEVGNYDF